MRKLICSAAVLLFAVSNIAGAATHHHPRHAAHHAKKTAQAVYTCRMHPEVRMHKPGKCPKCGMTLVKVK